MKFTVSTKPLSDVVNLGIINNNVSTFHKKSVVVEVCANATELHVNIETDSILTELVVKGSGDCDSCDPILVDSLLFKQLINTFDNNVTTLEFADDSLVLYNGTSKFTLDKMADIEGLSLNRPEHNYDASKNHAVDKPAWKFVKDHQMYAISIAYVHPVYTKVYAGLNGDIIVGDFDNGIFTYSRKNQLNQTCLLSDTIINMLNSLPEGATMAEVGSKYIVSLITDAYSLLTEFRPRFESDPDMGNYNADIILNLMTVDDSKSVGLDKSILSKFLVQSDLLSTTSENLVELELSSGILSVFDNKVKGKVAVTGNADLTFNVKFKSSIFKPLINNMDSDNIRIYPIIQDNVTNGVIVYTDTMKAMISGVD